MTEASWTSTIVTHLRNNGCVVFKHSDSFTTGVPDVSVTCLSYTTWLEMKYIKHDENFYKFVMKKKIQFFNMTALEAAGRAKYVFQKAGQMYIFSPRELMTKQQEAEPMAVYKSTDYYQILNLVRAA